MITCPITDADSPNAEAILDTASSLGIRHYWWGTFRYDQGKPVMQQLDELKPRVEKLAKLNEKYNMKALYHTYSMAGTVGCNVWDFLYVLRNFDAAHVAFHWDVGHTSLTGGNGTWAESLRASGPYVGGLSVKEYTYELNLETPGGGPFTGTPAQLIQRFGRPGPGGPPGAPAGQAGPGGAARVFLRDRPSRELHLRPRERREQQAQIRHHPAERIRAVPGNRAWAQAPAVQADLADGLRQTAVEAAASHCRGARAPSLSAKGSTIFRFWPAFSRKSIFRDRLKFNPNIPTAALRAPRTRSRCHAPWFWER